MENEAAPAVITAPKPKHRVDELVFGLASEVEDERKLCLTWLAQVGTSEVLPFIERMTADPAVSVRVLARQLAGELREKLNLLKKHEQIDDPTALLSHPDPKMRTAAAMTCYERTGPEIRDALLERLDVEADPFVRASLVIALKPYSEPTVIEKIADCLLDPDARVRSNSIEALMVYDHSGLFKRISHLLHDPDNRVRGTVLVYLARRKPERIRPLLNNMAVSNESWARQSAHYALRSLGWPIPQAPEIASEGTDEGQKTRDMFSEDAYELRIQAVWKALKLDQEERLSILREQLTKEDHPHVIATLTRAIGSPGKSEDLAILSPYLKSSDDRIRANTIEGVAKIGGIEALQLIEPMLEDPAPRVSATAALHLVKVRRQQSIEVLRSLLDSGDDNQLRSAFFSLSSFPEDEAAAILKAIARAWEPERTQQALHLLQQMAERTPAANWLAVALDSLVTDAGTGDALGRSGERPSRDGLFGLVRDHSSSEVQLETLTQLKKPGSQQHLSLLEVAAQNSGGNVSSFASQALVRVHNELVEGRVLVNLGADVVRIYESQEVDHEVLQPQIQAVQDIEEAMAHGRNLEENINKRYQLLMILGKSVMDLLASGKIENPALLRRLDTFLASMASLPRAEEIVPDPDDVPDAFDDGGSLLDNDATPLPEPVAIPRPAAKAAPPAPPPLPMPTRTAPPPLSMPSDHLPTLRMAPLIDTETSSARIKRKPDGAALPRSIPVDSVLADVGVMGEPVIDITTREPNVDAYELVERLTIRREGVDAYVARSAGGEDVELYRIDLDPADKPLAFHRFLHAMKVLTNLEHPQLAKVLDAGVTEGKIYYTTPRYPLPTLREERARTRGRLPIKTVLSMGNQLASALAALHEKGVVHRGLSLDGILYDGTEMVPRVVDFSQAIRREDGEELGTQLKTPLLPLPAKVPEELAGQPFDEKTDRYLLGTVLYAVLTGSEANGGDPSKLKSPGEINPDCEVDLSEQVMKLMSVAPGDRAGSTPEMVTTFERLASKHEVRKQLSDMKAVAGASRRISSADDSSTKLDRSTKSGKVAGPVPAPEGEPSAFASFILAMTHDAGWTIWPICVTIGLGGLGFLVSLTSSDDPGGPRPRPGASASASPKPPLLSETEKTEFEEARTAVMKLTVIAQATPTAEDTFQERWGVLQKMILLAEKAKKLAPAKSADIAELMKLFESNQTEDACARLDKLLEKLHRSLPSKMREELERKVQEETGIGPDDGGEAEGKDASDEPPSPDDAPSPDGATAPEGEPAPVEDPASDAPPSPGASP